MPQHFVGRVRLTAQVASDLEGGANSPLVIIGEPGIGKTALISELGIKLAADVIHYCSRRQGSSIEPIAFSKSLSSQLASRLIGFTNCLASQLDPSINISVNQSVTDSPGSQISALNIGNLAAQSWSAYQAFERLVKAPLREWCALNPTHRIVFLVDAINEAYNPGFSPNIFDLLVASEDLPRQVRLVLTSRDIEAVQLLPGRKLRLLASDPENVSDIDLYISQYTDDVGVPLRDRLPRSTIQAVVAKCEGNFLYATYIVRQILRILKSSGNFGIPNLTELPAGLESLYRDFMHRLTGRISQQSWRTEYRPVLGVLCAAYDAITLSEVSQFVNKDEQTISDVLSDISDFIDPEAKPKGLFRLYHASFSDFVSDRNASGPFWIDLIATHRSLSRLIMARWGSSWSASPLYALRHVSDHLSAVDKAALESILLDYGWLAEAIARTPFESVMHSYSQLPESPDVRTLDRALRLSAHVISNEPGRLAEQLVGRLEGIQGRLADFITEIRHKHHLAWLRPVKNSLGPLGGLEYRTLASESGIITAICFGDSETCLISGSEGGSTVIWDLETFQPRYVLPGPASPVTCLACRDDLALAVGYGNGDIRIWNMQFGTQTARYKASTASIAAISIAKDDRVVFADARGLVFELDLKGDKSNARKRVQWSSPFSTFSLSRDGTTVAYLGASLEVWSIDKSTKRYHCDEATDGLWNAAVALSADGSTAVSTYHDGLLLHDTKSMPSSARANKQYIFHYWADRICFGPSGKRVYWIGRRGSDFGGNVGSPSLEAYELPDFKPVLSTRGSAVPASGLGVSKNERFLAYSYSKRVVILNLEAAKPDETEQRIAINRIVVSPDGSLAICTINRDGALLYDLDGGSCVGGVHPDPTMYYRGPGGGTYAAAFSSNGEKLVVGSYSAMLRVLMQVGKMRSNNALVASADREIRCDLKFSGGRASYVVFIDGDDTFACTNEEGHILIWKVCRHEPIRTIPAHKESVTKLVVLPGGSHLASCSIDGFVRLWNWKNGKLVAESKIRGGRIHDMAVTSEGKAYLASEDLVLRAVDLRTGASVGELSIPERDDHYVSEDKPWLLWRTRVAVTPTGVVVFTTIDNQVGFLRPPGQLVMSKTHRATIRDLALDRDGRFAVTAGSDGMVCVWGTTKTELVASFRTENDVRACGITPHGAKVICGEISGNVHVLQLENVESDLS